MDTRVKESKCPVCGKILDTASSIDGDHTPSPNDITLCMYCAALLIFNKDMTMSKCPYHIVEKLPPDVILKLGKATVAILFRNKKPSP